MLPRTNLPLTLNLSPISFCFFVKTERNLLTPALAARAPSKKRDALGNLASDYITNTANREIPSHLALGETKVRTKYNHKYRGH